MLPSARARAGRAALRARRTPSATGSSTTSFGALRRTLDVVMPASRETASPRCSALFEPDLALCARLPVEDPCRRTGRAAARHRERASVAAPSLPRAEPGVVGDPERRDRDRLHVPLHGRRARYGRNPRAGDDPARRRALVGRARAQAGRRRSARSSRRVLERVEQGDPGRSAATRARRLLPFFEPEYAWIDWARPRAEIARQVRAWRFHSPAHGRPWRAARARRRDGPRAAGQPRASRRPRRWSAQTAHSGSWRRRQHEAGHRDHVVRAGRALGRLAPAGRARPARLRGRDRARRRPRRASSRRRGGHRADARHARRDRLLGRCGRRSRALRRRRAPRDRHAAGAPRRAASSRCCRRRSSATCRRSRSAAASSC